MINEVSPYYDNRHISISMINCEGNQKKTAFFLHCLTITVQSYERGYATFLRSKTFLQKNQYFF